MPKPIPGQIYTVEPGDSLSRIAVRAYGDQSFWPRIWSANQTRLQAAVGGAPNPNLIFPGETIIIPVLPEREVPSRAVSARDPESMFLDIAGREIRPLSGRIIRTIDTVANAYTMSIPWESGADLELDAAIAPYSYSPAIASIGPDRIVTGVNYTVETAVGQGNTARLAGATPTADLVDSKLAPPFEYNKITLPDIIAQLVEPLGFRVVIEADATGVFDRVTATQGDTIFGFLAKLAKQRSVLLSCDVFGNLVVTRAAVDSIPVALIEEGVTSGVTGWGAEFDGRKRFNAYRVVSRSPLGAVEAVVTDDRVPRSRFTTAIADELTKGEIEPAAQWERNKTLADALTFRLVVPGFRDPVTGDLWRENTIVTVISSTMFISAPGFAFLLKRVEYILAAEGATTILSFVPPSVYTQGEIEEPW